jgi:DAK2 domain fusion protein YloV
MRSRETRQASGHDPTRQGFIIQDEKRVACTGAGFTKVLLAGKQWLELHRQIVDGLNVFPVPDGDTGTNMLLTMQAAVEQVEKLSGAQAGMVASAAAHGALLGARGNSGVILSQFVQGVADGLSGCVTFSVKDLAAAMQLGTELAYQSVAEPVEGTILTVATAVSQAAGQSAQSRPDFGIFMAEIVEAARAAQARTPELLPVLKEAGVTDSGGQGLLYILEGGLRFLNKQPITINSTKPAAPMLRSSLGVGEKSFGYDVQFLIEGEQLDVERIRSQIDRMGSSTVVVGDEHTVKVHIHVDDPDQPLDYGAGQGQVSKVVVENLGEQANAFVRERFGQLDQAKSNGDNGVAVISVASGDGLTDIFHSLGAHRVVPGGQTMNPSAKELLDVVERIDTDRVLLLPNNNNIILTARQVQRLSKKDVGVVPTRTIPQGIAALLSFNDRADVGTNVRRMSEAGQLVHTLEFTKATRKTTFNGFNIETGDVLGLFDDEIVSVGGEYFEVVLATLAGIEFNGWDIITIYYGQDGSREQADQLAAEIEVHYPAVEVEVYFGGQPHYYYIISLE